jgi:hypothetical protein
MMRSPVHARSAAGRMMVKRAPEGASSRSHVNLPVMAFDDRPGDRKAESRMAAEILASGLTEWKRLKIASRASGDAGAFVVDADADLVADRVAAISTSPPGGEKLIALSMILSIARASRSGSPMTIALAGAAGRRRSGRRRSRAASPSWHELLDQRPRSTGSNRARASSASVRAASLMSPISRSSRTTSWR